MTEVDRLSSSVTIGHVQGSMFKGMSSGVPKCTDSFQVLLARVTGGRRLTLYEPLAVRGDLERNLQRNLETWRVDESRLVAQLHNKNDATSNVQPRLLI